jgi:hypothetical protein
MPAVPHIGVIGEGSCSRPTAALARRVGAAVARAGAVLFCGGRGGVMAAAARGAGEAGGVVVGILPGFQRGDANRWVTIPVVTGMDQARYGTLSEIAIALKIGRPVIGLGTWRLRLPGGGRAPIVRAISPEAAVTRALRAARGARGSRGWLS